MTSTSTNRLEAFSDGIYAFAITLLVLEIKAPTAHELEFGHGLWPALARRWPNYVGFLLSFFIIGIMWINHHAVFVYIRRADRRLMLANLLLLVGVSFLPFPTAILAEHLADPATRTAATVFYGATLVFNSGTYNLLWWAGRTRPQLMDSNLDRKGLRTITTRYTLAFFCYAAATCLALVNVWLSLMIHLALGLTNARSERR